MIESRHPLPSPKIVAVAAYVACRFALLASGAPRIQAAPTDYQVAVYYWPNFHVDPRNEEKLGRGWTEWELVKSAMPRFPGHAQPKVPEWGCTDETNPKAMEHDIQAMRDYGITTVIFDWYRYDNGSFLEDALRKGFLQAPNRNSVKFALMWANHDYVDLFPAAPGKPHRLWHPGPVTRKTFDETIDTVIKDFFSQPNYWKINGAPYFSIYELNTLERGLGGRAALQDALRHFREKTKAAGFPDLHLNAVAWGLDHLSLKPERKPASAAIESMGKDVLEPPRNVAELAGHLGISSVTSYCWIHHVPIPNPTGTYKDWAAKSEARWPGMQSSYSVPYFPNVSMGWDSSPRTDSKQPWNPALGYPYTGVITDNTPAEFKGALVAAKRYLDREPKTARILTINAWNEWTEGSYLLPDRVHGTAYLEAIRDVFGNHPPQRKAMLVESAEKGE